MKILGLTISRTKAAPATAQPVPSARRGGLFGVIRESFTGAWQKNIEVDAREDLLANGAVWSCVSILAGDIAKMRIKLVEKKGRIWREVEHNSPYLKVLKKPNRFQNRITFLEQWITSKLLNGNTYVLKVREGRGMVSALYVLNPLNVTPRVTPQGDVYYTLTVDNLAGVAQQITVPASEIIHDRWNCLFHPLVGVSPIYACGRSATLGNRIQNNSGTFFANMSRPSGMLTAPSSIGEDTAVRLKEAFEKGYSGENIGRMFVAGDGLEFKPIAMSADDAQLIEQLKWTREDVASCFHMPLYKVAAGAMPTYNNIEALNQQYLDSALSPLIESLELCLDEGLEMPDSMGTEMDTSVLLRMDTAARYKAWSEGIRGGWMTPNKARENEDMEPVEGGDSCYMQQQNYSLAALAARDAAGPPPGTTPPPQAVEEDPSPEDVVKDFLVHLSAAFEEVEHA